MAGGCNLVEFSDFLGAPRCACRAVLQVRRLANDAAGDPRPHGRRGHSLHGRLLIGVTWDAVLGIAHMLGCHDLKRKPAAASFSEGWYGSTHEQLAAKTDFCTAAARLETRASGDSDTVKGHGSK